MSGLDCFLDGFRLILAPGLRRYFIVPTVVNVLVLTSLLAVTYAYLGVWVDLIMGWFPDWMSLLYWLVWFFAFIVVLVLIVFCFTFIANIISSPFNALLSIKVEEHLTGRAPVSEVSLWLVLPRSLGREISKLLYVLPRLAGLLLVTVIPLLNLFAPVLWLLFGAWMMTVQYSDYGADNSDVSFKGLRERLGRRRFQGILFGLPAYLLLTIPGINLVLMPAGVAGGTRFWIEHLKN